jgi:hypothetical protein
VCRCRRRARSQRSLEGRPGAAEDRRKRSFEKGGAVRRLRERRRPRVAVAGGSAGGGCGGGVVSSAVEARPSSFSLAGGTAAELLPLLFFLPRTFSFPISVLIGAVRKLPGGTVTHQELDRFGSSPLRPGRTVRRQ